MKDAITSIEAVEAIREACIEAALGGYEDALTSGLCREGAWEAAVSAIRRADLGGIVADTPLPDPSREAATSLSTCRKRARR